MKRFSSAMVVSTATLLLIGGCSQPAQPTPAPAPQSVSKPVVTQEAVTSKASLEIKAPEAEMKLKTFEAKEYGFQIRYPETWEVKDKVGDGMGIIVTANDNAADKEWGGTNLNIHVVAAEDSDAGLGWKTVKTDKYVNWTGTVFNLTYNEPDMDFDAAFPVDLRTVDISTKLVPGLVRFSYDAKKNPDAEKQLMLLLENFIPMN